MGGQETQEREKRQGIQERQESCGPGAGPAAGKPIVVVEGLTARFGQRTIFEKVSFTVRRGEIFVILGESGFGKTTLMKHLIGLYKPAEGRVLVDGIDPARADPKDIKKVRKRIGVLFQTGALFASMTLGENVALPLREYTNLPPGMITSLVKLKLGMVQLAGYENHLPSELSGGMRIRAGLARAIALDPSVLFLDEPSAGLDPITTAEIDDLIRSINRGMGTTLVIITQVLESVFAVADRVIMLDKDAKGIIAEGNPHELKEKATDERVLNFFNRRTHEGEKSKAA